MTQYFPKTYEPFRGDINVKKLTCIIMQQKLIERMQ